MSQIEEGPENAGNEMLGTEKSQRIGARRRMELGLFCQAAEDAGTEEQG